MSNETACVTRRTKGDGTIFQNKKGRWIARYKRKGFPPKKFSGKTRAEAQAKMDEYKFLVLSGNLVNHLLPLEEYAVKFLNYKSKQVKRGTIKQATYNSAGKLNYRFGPALVFALNTGVREGELITISKNGIMVDKNNHPYLHISETISRVKNRDPKINRKYIHIVTPPKYPRSVRNIPLNPEALHCLKIMDTTYTEMNLVRSDFILTTDTGNLPTARHMQDTFDRILKVCNMQHYGTHSLRHTFATKLLEKTKNLRDIKTVAAIMGDDYKVIIKTYLHPDEDNKYDLVASL